MSDNKCDPGFAPSDPTDSRACGEWDTRYPDAAKTHIRQEASYLAAHLATVLLTVFVLTIYSDEHASFLTVTKDTIRWPQLLFAYLGGVLGGTLNAMKWLYHSVAKNIWNLDRRLWRFFTPHLSGGLAFAVVILLGSGLLVIIDRQTMLSVWVSFGVGFLVGLFSDSATAKLAEVAQTLFGTRADSDNPGS